MYPSGRHGNSTSSQIESAVVPLADPKALNLVGANSGAAFGGSPQAIANGWGKNVQYVSPIAPIGEPEFSTAQPKSFGFAFIDGWFGSASEMFSWVSVPFMFLLAVGVYPLVEVMKSNAKYIPAVIPGLAVAAVGAVGTFAVGFLSGVLGFFVGLGNGIYNAFSSASKPVPSIPAPNGWNI